MSLRAVQAWLTNGKRLACRQEHCTKCTDTNHHTIGCPFFCCSLEAPMIPGAPENKALPISPIHVGYKLGYRHAFLSCAFGATLDLNKAPNIAKVAETFRIATEACQPNTDE